jgi:UDP-N-acetylglucosamine 2-epimerase
MAPVIKALEQHTDRVRPVVCVTGQHREMLAHVLSLFAIKPDYDLDVMEPDQSLSRLAARLITALDEVVEQTQPDWILAAGDTSTVFAASLVAYHHRAKFGHVEAGLRTGNKYHPYPEEIYRRLSDVIADAAFAPTEHARQNLLREHYPEQNIYVTGNPVVDALLDVTHRPYDWDSGPLAALPRDGRIVLVTAHRRESFGAPFRELCLAIRDLAGAFEGENVHFVYPVHLNPNVQRPVRELLSDVPNLTLLDPLDYLSLAHLLKRAVLVLTDSGGLQEEAPALGVPVLVMRNTTERPEGLEVGVARLVGTERDQIVAEAARLLRDPDAHAAMVHPANPYGDGQAARRIVSIILGQGAS